MKFLHKRILAAPLIPPLPVMNTSCKSRKLISTIPLLVILIHLLSQVAAQPNICTPNGGYTNNTSYHVNLRAILSTLPLNLPDNGYYSASITVLTTAETINAFALCRGDLTPTQCRACVNSAAPDVLRICLNQRQGVIWSDSNCLVRYTDDALNPPTTSVKFILASGIIAADTAQFKVDRDALLSDLRGLAAAGSTELKVGGGKRSTSSVGSESSAIYGLVQCRPDLTSGDCEACLGEATAALQNCCDFRTGVRVLKPDCTLQYEITRFYNVTHLCDRGVLFT